MALAFLGRCIWRAASSGSGSFVVASAITGYLVPESCLNPVVVNAATYRYFAQSDDKTQWERGLGVYTTADDTLTRATIKDSSNAGSAVTFSAAPSVFMGGTDADDWPFSGVALGGEFISITAGSGTDGQQVEFNGGEGTSGNGGAVNFSGGTGSVDGGPTSLSGGQGGNAGGSVNLNGGAGTSSDGGAVSITGGPGTGGGAISITGGSGASVNGGAITLLPGDGSVDGGDVTITLPAAGSGRQGLIIISNLPTSNPSVTGALWSNGGVLTVS